MLIKGLRPVPLRTLAAVPMLALALWIGVMGGSGIAGLQRTQVLPALVPASGSTLFDCSHIKELGIDRQLNAHAAQIMLQCSGQHESQVPSPKSKVAWSRLGTLDLGLGTVAERQARPDLPLLAGLDVNTITGLESYPHVTQAGSFLWAEGNTVVVNYNDSSVAAPPSNSFAGISYSTNGGATFSRALPAPFISGHGTNYGDPIVVYNRRLGAWFAGDVVSGCGGQGIGLWTSTDGVNWAVGECAYSSIAADHPSMWVDNNPASRYYGRMYISLNDFGPGFNGILRVVYSDTGTEWSTFVNPDPFVYRNVQITGGQDGRVYVAAIDEGGGGFNPRTHKMYKSDNGGATWTASIMASGVAAPGSSLCAADTYFPIIEPIWRYLGWGHPAAGPGAVVHYAYGAHGASGDDGDIYYVRSTDGGVTWSVPFQLNDDASGREQWMPSVSATGWGAVTVSWYDRRNTTDGQNYEYRARVSTDNGATWGPSQTVSDLLIPQPAQPDTDPVVPACFAGDYNYQFASDNAAYLSWTDGRVPVNGTPQEDVFFDRIPLTPSGTPPTVTATSTPTPMPTHFSDPHYVINSTTGHAIVPGDTLIPGSQCDECLVYLPLPFSYTLYSTVFDHVYLSDNGTLGFALNNPAFSNVCLPDSRFNHAIFAHWDDLTMSPTITGSSLGVLGVYKSITGTVGSRVLNLEWRACRYDGAGRCGGDVHFEVRLYENQTRFDIVYGEVSHNGRSATIGAQGAPGDQVTNYSCNSGEIQFGQQLRFDFGFSLLGTTATRTSTPTISPTNTPAPPTATPTCGPELQYNFSESYSAPIVPTSNFVPDSNCRGCILEVPLPFPYTFYDQQFSTINVSSSGNLQFTSNNNSADARHTCSLATAFNYAIYAHWDDLDMSLNMSPTLGIYTSTSGIAPNRTFNIEWVACRDASGTCGGLVDFEVRLYESQGRFDIIYGMLAGGGTNASVGVSGATASQVTGYSCDENRLVQGLQLTFQQACAPPAPTITNTPTATPTNTPTPVLVCHVTWQGISVPTPGARWSRTITATLRLASGGTYYDFSGTTDQSGYYTVPVSTLPNGTYNVRVQGPNNLATCRSVTLAGAATTQLDMGQQPAGDANRNNVVNVSDFVILKNTNGIACGQPSFDGRADFNNDCVVNAVDFSLLKNNNGTAGCNPLIVPGGRYQLEPH